MRPTIQRTALIGLATGGLLLAADALHSITEHIDFPQDGVLRLKKSIGELTIEGQDRSDVEITTVKSLKDDVDSRKRHGNELVITTAGPRRRYLSYSLKVPRNARLIVEHGEGEVHIVNVSGEIHVKAQKGEITLRLPEIGHYAIDAGSRFGNVISDFPAHPKRRFWLVGHQMNSSAPGPSQSLHLRIGYGDILILRERIPPPPFDR